MHLSAQHELLSDHFPHVLWPLKPLVYHLQLLPPSDERDQTIKACAEMVHQLKRRCALVLAANACVYFEADGTWKFTEQPPTGGIAIPVEAHAPQPQPAAPQWREAPEPPRGIEICRDDQAAKSWAAARCGRRNRWRIVRYEYNESGNIVREKEFEGDAYGFYLYARNTLGCDITELPAEELRLPDAWSLYRDAVSRELKGKRFSHDVYSICCSWTIQYSISRTRKGWMLYVALEPWDSDPLRDPEIESVGPFRTKQEVRDYLDERGLNSEVKF